MQTWFAAQLEVLKGTDDATSLTSPLRLEPSSALSPTSPYLPIVTPVQPDEQLKLPLSSAMALYVPLMMSNEEQVF